MDSYSPRISHYFAPLIIFVIAETARHYGYNVFGILAYIVGMCAGFVVTYSFVLEARYRYALREEERQHIEREEHLDELQSVHVEVNTSPSQTRIFDLPATPRQLETLATALLIAGESFSQGRWTGKGRPLSINEFNALRDEMIVRGLLQPKSDKDKRQGYTLTTVGRAVFKRFLPSPTLQGFEAQTDDR
jgi:hypothetical protein